MKKLFIVILAVSMATSTTSCATVFGGQLTEVQQNKPEQGSRGLRVGFVILDVLLFPPALIVDFATKKIYKKY